MATHPKRSKSGIKRRSPAPVALIDMRSVAAGRPPRNPGQSALARLLADDPDKFYARLTRLEVAYAVGKAPRSGTAAAPTAPSVPLDVGSRRALEVIDRILAASEDKATRTSAAEAIEDESAAPFWVASD